MHRNYVNSQNCRDTETMCLRRGGHVGVRRISVNLKSAVMTPFCKPKVAGEAISRRGLGTCRATIFIVILAVFGIAGDNVFQGKEIFSTNWARARELQQPRIDAGLMKAMFTFAW